MEPLRWFGDVISSRRVVKHLLELSAHVAAEDVVRQLSRSAKSACRLAAWRSRTKAHRRTM